MLPTLFGILLISFVIIQFVPGGPVEQIIDQSGLSQIEACAVLSQLVRARESGRSRPDDGDAPARRGAGRIEPEARFRGAVAGKPLQAADLDRRFQQCVIDTRAFAQDVRRTDTGAGAPEDIGVEDRPRRADRIAMQYLTNEPGNVDARGTRPHAGRVVAIQAS